MENDNNNEIRISDLFKNLKKNLTKTIIFSLIVMVVSFAGILFATKGKKEYITEFQFYWPNIESEKYPDGSTFNYNNIISYENLENAINSDDELKNIDIDNMISEDNIQIERIKNNTDEQDKETIPTYSYKITLKQKYFHNKDQAVKFIKTLIEDQTFLTTQNYINNFKMIDFFSSQNENTEYSEMIDNISKQINLEKNAINQLINESSKHFVYDKENNLTLSDLENEFTSFLSNNDYSHFSYEMKINNYIRNVNTYKKMFEERKFAINYEMEKNILKINALTSIPDLPNQPGQDSIPQKVAVLTLRNVELQYELDYINACLSAATFNQDFDNKITNYQAKLLEYKTKIESAYKAVFIQQTSLKYSTNKILISVGFGTTKCAVLSIIITILFIGCLSLTFTYTENNKKKKLLENKE